MQLRERIEKSVEKNKQQLVDYCRRLIDIPSVTGNEGAVQEEVSRMMKEIGLDIDMWEPDDQEMRKSDLFSETGESFAGRPVVAGFLHGRGNGKSLLVNGHVDVVNEYPREKWDRDPFKSAIENGKLYGRGASDMKSGVALALFTAKMIRDMGIDLKGDFAVISVPGEENGGNGTVASVLRGYTDFDAAIYPEPTSNQIQPAHRGAAFWRIHIEGKASHGGTKYQGVSAVEKGMKIARELEKLEEKRNEEICSKHPMYADYPLSAPVTLGIFRGGQFTSGVPEACTLEGCIEYVPGEKSGDVCKMLEAAVLKTCEGDEWLLAHRPRVEWFGLLYEPAETRPDHPFVETVKGCYREMLGKEPRVNGFEAGTDMRVLANRYGVPGVMFGPGDIAMAHAPNEYVEIEKLVDAAKVLLLLVIEWCGFSENKEEA